MEQDTAYVKHISVLIFKHLRGELSPVEKAELQDWVSLSLENKKLFDEISSSKSNQTAIKGVLKYDTDMLLSRVKSRMNQVDPILKSSKKRNNIKILYLASTAIVLLALSFSLYFFQGSKIESSPSFALKEEILPGGNKATMTLADGSVIDLSEEQMGVTFENNRLTYLDGTIVFNEENFNSKQEELNWITVETPKGGQYQIVLSDGTKVWLNAGSKLKYPAYFEGGERRVELSGEAYFEVEPTASKSSLPAFDTPRSSFVVSSKGQEVKVLGTHFNISAFEDELSTKTTLLEGAVEIISKSNSDAQKQNSVLEPGQQAVLTQAGDLVIQHVDQDAVVAWKNGLFSFKNENIQRVMKQFERWYDIEVIYEGIIPQTTFSGKIHRSEQIDKVLSLLAYYKVTYEVTGRQIKITGKQIN